MNFFYLCRRISMLILTMLMATFLTFLLLRLSPGDPAELMIQKVFIGSEEYSGSIEEKTTISKRLQLGSPLIVQYGHWLVGLLRMDLGVSYTTGQRVSHELGLHLWPTLSLALISLGLSLIMTIMVSTIYNLSTWPLVHRFLECAIITSIAVPNFYLGILCILLFSIHFDLLPVSGYGTPAHYVLPVITLAATLFGYTTTLLNDSIKESSSRTYMLTAKAKGLSRMTIFRNHILRNAAAPVVPYVALQLGYLLGGVVVIETLFSWPGIGKYLIDAIGAKDIPVIQACIAAIACGFSLTNLAADLVIWMVDPRVRF